MFARCAGPDGDVKHRYPIKLAPRHVPAAGRDDPVMAEWRKLSYGSFLCYNSNQFSGREHPDARALILAQLHELATGYGPIPLFGST